MHECQHKPSIHNIWWNISEKCRNFSINTPLLDVPVTPTVSYKLLLLLWNHAAIETIGLLYYTLIFTQHSNNCNYYIYSLTSIESLLFSRIPTSFITQYSPCQWANILCRILCAVISINNTGTDREICMCNTQQHFLYIIAHLHCKTMQNYSQPCSKECTGTLQSSNKEQWDIEKTG